MPNDIVTYLTLLDKQLQLSDEQKCQIDASISYFKEKVWATFQDKLSEVMVFGSYDRNTLILPDEEADVDILVSFKEREFEPNTYLNQIKRLCNKYYSTSQIFQDHPTIVIGMDHIRFEILPCYAISNNQINIPAPKNSNLKWIVSSPKKFKQQVLTKNKEEKEFILPTIRILKYWNLKNGNFFHTYELEKAVVDKDYSCKTIRDYFFYSINSLESIANTPEKKTALVELREKRRRLKVLEEGRMLEYIEAELSSFLPMPN